MAKEFNKDIFMRNVYHLLQGRDIKVGDLERSVGVSVGYLAKLKKNADLRPGIDLVIKIAEKLEVSIDTLVGVDMDRLTATEAYMQRFLQKLKRDTEGHKLRWGRETKAELSNLKGDINGNVDHPFFSFEEFVVDTGNDYPSHEEGFVFVSDAFGAETAIHGDCYNLRMKNGAKLFLADVEKVCHYLNDFDAYAKEIWMHTGAGKQFLCSNKNMRYANFVNNLFTAVAEYCRHPQLPADYRSVIDAFMKDDLADDISALMPDEPPF
ncbi:MAG: helix-turn-helix domain-containing protein [Succiniclasticum sp.]|uniref:helix-turn-helix domain-containing protein n=1 Tax=Succiniclasticum sp. TaxID=2775030 RepID=UPI002A911B75|nr:helix-turn-helix domain-containing protein [Succiniclasticum sp.]MDY6291999.1 helix-turn-helix domain-containing protein [Succiniclasticum sp.]